MQELFFCLHFTFIFKNYKGIEKKAKGRLFFDEVLQQMYLMQNASILKDQYSDRDIKEIDRLNSLTPIKEGDIVLIEGKQYSVRILGDYSDAGRFYPVE